MLFLEVKYTARDYLLDNNRCDSSENAASRGNYKRPHGTSHDETPVRLNNDRGDVNNDEASSTSRIISSTIMNNAPITELQAINWREKICEWSYQVADHFDLPRDIVYVTLNYIDRVCAVSNGVELLLDKKRFQLLAMAALCIAIKVHGEVDTSVSGAESLIVHTILHLARGHFTAQELELMEIDALQRLQWLLNPPTPQLFVSYFIELFCTDGKVELNDIALYLVELSVHDCYFIASNPSVIALAALWNAARMLGQSEWCTNEIQRHLLQHYGYEESTKIDACRDRLDKLYRSTDTNLEDFEDISSPIALECNEQLNEIGRDYSPTSIID